MQLQATIDGRPYTLFYATNGGNQVCHVEVLKGTMQVTDDVRFETVNRAWEICREHNLTRKTEIQESLTPLQHDLLLNAMHHRQWWTVEGLMKVSCIEKSPSTESAVRTWLALNGWYRAKRMVNGLHTWVYVNPRITTDAPPAPAEPLAAPHTPPTPPLTCKGWEELLQWAAEDLADPTVPVSTKQACVRRLVPHLEKLVPLAWAELQRQKSESSLRKEAP